MKFQSHLAIALILSLPACGLPQQPSVPLTQSALLASAAIAVGKAPHGIAAAQGFIYNANTGDGTISVIDAARNAVVKTLTVPGGKPGYFKATHAGGHLLMLDPEAGKLHVFEPGKDHALLQSIGLGRGPDKIVLSPDDAKAWVSLTGEATLVELDFSQGLAKAPLINKLRTGLPSPDGKGHRAVAAGSAWVAVPNPGDNDISLFGPQNQALRIATGNEPAALAIAALDGRDRILIVANKASNTVSLVSLPERSVTTLADLGQTPTDIALDSGRERAFVTMAGTNEVAVIDYRQQKLLGRIPVGKRPVHIYAAPTPGDELWVCNDAGDSVSLIDAASLRVSATLTVGKGHHKVAFWGQKAFVSNITDGTVSPIDRPAVKGQDK